VTHFHTFGGGIDQTAVIGHAPEHRDWRPGDPALEPDIHPTARIEAFCTVDAGTKVPTRIGAGTWLMKRVHVGHDAWIGDNCELTPGVTIGGHVKIGHGVKIGLNASVRPGVTIGEGARIGMGAVVVCDVPANEVWVGVPAERLRVDNDDTDVMRSLSGSA
jgi:acetyltransferase-like isoleucine patch superfamily enzyme